MNLKTTFIQDLNQESSSRSQTGFQVQAYHKDLVEALDPTRPHPMARLDPRTWTGPGDMDH